MKLENLCEIRHYPSESHLLHSKIDVITFSNDYRGYSSFFSVLCFDSGWIHKLDDTEQLSF